MVKTKAWIGAMRLRTLPLSLSGIIAGSAFAHFKGSWDFNVFILAISTTILFQILSNLANDLGDGQKGTDNEQRIGPERAVQSGIISQNQMKFGVIIVSLLSFISALSLIFFSSTYLSETSVWIYIGLTILSIISAILYTVGKSAYGYHGFGDIMVFIFFGLLSVFGVYLLYGVGLDWVLICPAITIGFWSTAVLNLNNMRDIVNDELSGKRTVVVQLGQRRAKTYHFSLILVGFMSWAILNGVFILLTNSWIFAISIIPSVLLYPHLIRIMEIKEPYEYDAELKKVALITFSSSVLFAISLFTA